jgi:hypothetical protein
MAGARTIVNHATKGARLLPPVAVRRPAIRGALCGVIARDGLWR